jgi:uncharacterized membrane protein
MGMVLLVLAAAGVLMLMGGCFVAMAQIEDIFSTNPIERPGKLGAYAMIVGIVMIFIAVLLGSY